MKVSTAALAQSSLEILGAEGAQDVGQSTVAMEGAVSTMNTQVFMALTYHTIIQSSWPTEGEQLKIILLALKPTA